MEGNDKNMSEERKTHLKFSVGSFVLTMACVILFDFYGYIGWVFASTVFLGVVFFGVFLGAIGELTRTS